MAGSIPTARSSWACVPTSVVIRRIPDLKIAWKILFSSKDTWLGPTLNLGAIGSTYNLTMDPYEKYDMTFNGAVATRNPTSSPGRYSGMDNGWAISLLRHSALGVQQVDRPVSEQDAIPGRSFERHDPEPAEPGEPAALRSDQGAEDHRSALGAAVPLGGFVMTARAPVTGRPRRHHLDHDV